MMKFKKIYIEITNACNLSCDFCPQTKRKSEFIDFNKFSYILDEIKPYGEYIYFHVKGEPLLHRDIDKLLDLSYEKGFKVNITTNGTLIKNVQDRLIGKPGLRQINFSLHSFDGNQTGENKYEYIDNIISFAKNIRKSSDTLISFRLWNLDEDNSTNIKKKRNREILEIIEREFNLPYKIEEKINPGRGIKISEGIFLNQDYEFQWPDLKVDEDRSGTGFCYGLKNQIAILVDGTVVPCCLDGEGVINLGNIYKDSFSEIVEGERARNIIKGFSRREVVEELCRKCGYRKRFNTNK
ncbi:SPASM domain-containing protein [Clostridium sp. MSJ-4]|uniref:SPASM domain-containing protein n=1 Tax=Clostridium simiarum TaxID=2841506 RepID=A0ABS6F0J1_9CLOT|nr:radical SAM/SPASM domain-containing protein [Clostridium simiarum]MBU5592019.1 SPASM domain-containing protein [Clostridium simiarum]